MEWKWIKTLLIIIFICINCFLLYQIRQKDNAVATNSEMIGAIREIFINRNIQCDIELEKIEYRGRMKKIIIADEENLSESFISLTESEGKETIGRNREIVLIPLMISNFIRDTGIKDVTIEKIELGYFPELSQIDKNVLSGEAIPAWRIKLGTGEEYIYNAYLGEKMK